MGSYYIGGYDTEELLHETLSLCSYTKELNQRLLEIELRSWAEPDFYPNAMAAHALPPGGGTEGTPKRASKRTPFRGVKSCKRLCFPCVFIDFGGPKGPRKAPKMGSGPCAPFFVFIHKKIKSPTVTQSNSGPAGQ